MNGLRADTVMNSRSARLELSAVPLASLPLVVLDTETTGLDVTRDRIIEIGAVRLGMADAEGPVEFSSFVNPGIPIPPAASAVHGIQDHDISDAPDFATVMAELEGWAREAIVVGFAIGFDFAVLKAECARSGLLWKQPRALDVRALLQILRPDLPEYSLETAAAWLGLPVTGRHRALGDAALTAEIFLAVLPKLKARGVRTLAQAERASSGQISRIGNESRAGWQSETATEPDIASDLSVFARIDSFPYRHRVGDLMTSPAIKVEGQMLLRDALQMMISEKVSSLFVQPRADRSDHGIITERDVLRALAESGANILDRAVQEFAKVPLVTIRKDEFVYRALSQMARHGFRHLGVVDDSGLLVGALSARDLLKQRADDAIRFGSSIETAATAEGLGHIWQFLPGTARALALEGVDARDISSVISRELRALTQRACELASRELAAHGLGCAPVPFAVMVLGSGGRGESLLAMDQDNAIVYAQAGSGPETDAWFERFAIRVSDILDAAGVSYCKGGVMASNSAWRMDAVRWNETVRSWISRSRPQDILNCDIFFDAFPVYGDAGLADQLRSEAIEIARHARVFLSQLAINASDYSTPVGWFGQLKTEQGRIDLKRNGIMPIFSSARVAALKHGLDVRSTIERLQAVAALGVVSQDVVSDLIESHRIFLDFILHQQLRDLDRGLVLSNSVAHSELSNLERQQLKWAAQRVPSIADLLGIPPTAI